MFPYHLMLFPDEFSPTKGQNMFWDGTGPWWSCHPNVEMIRTNNAATAIAPER